MEWYEKFKINQKVKVIKKVLIWDYHHSVRWNSREMDKTIGKVYEIVRISKRMGYRLDTMEDTGYDFWYPAQSLVASKGQQLLFNFMC